MKENASEYSKYSLDFTYGEWEPKPDLVCNDRKPADFGTSVVQEGFEFKINGPIAKPKSMKWEHNILPIDFSKYSFIVMCYKAEGLYRENSEQAVLFISGHDEQGKYMEVPLIKLSNLITDGNIHTVIIKKKIAITGTRFLVCVDSRDSSGYINVRSFELLSAYEEFITCMETDNPSNGARSMFSCIDLARIYNSDYEKLLDKNLNRFETSLLVNRTEDPVIIDGGRFFDDTEVWIEGIPFIVKPVGLNLVSPPPESDINDDIMENFGLKVRRGQVAPISRDDVIEIDVDAQVSEVFFLLAAEIPSNQVHMYWVVEKPVNGQYIDEIHKPFTIEDIECFAVELIYADGTKDFTFPYSMKSSSHVIQGTFGAYVVPTRECILHKVVFHNRMIGKTIHVAAVTVNTTMSRQLPELVIESEQTYFEAGSTASINEKKPYINCTGSNISIGNLHLDLKIDVSRGFKIAGITNRWLSDDNIKLSGLSGLNVTRDSKTLSEEDIELIGISKQSYSDCEKIEVTYKSINCDFPIEFKVEMLIGEKPEIKIQLTVVNKSEEKFNAGIVFPKLNNLIIGSLDDTWYFYPKYRNILSNSYGSHYNQSSGSFPMQFYDVFNPRLSGGIYIMTCETNHIIRRYGLSKNEKGISCFIEYPERFTHLEPNETFVCSETVIGIHRGDWHAAADSYRNWVKTWYKPYKSQNKQWYRESFWLIAEIADTLEPNVYKLPTWYDEEKDCYNMRSIIEEHKRVAGRSPDILHFWAWCFSKEEYNQIYGGYGSADYEKLGGLKNFREALDDIQIDMKIPISLYLNATLCNKSYPVASEIGLNGCMIKENGEPLIVESTNSRMCHANKKWRDYMVDTYKRVYAETGAKILYVDEFSLIESHFCYSKNHGHEVPLNLLKADNMFIKALREALPEEVVLYGEFPATDVNSQYIDCNINYYIVDMQLEQLAPAFDNTEKNKMLAPVSLNLYRFIFPGIVQLDLPIGVRRGSWNPLKFTFFNGDAIYDSFWDIEESKAHEFILRAYDIKKKYADCFTSNTPEMLVQTIKTGICANMFPGQGRTIWTLFNRRYTTLRGELISVHHKEGALYIDVWNNVRIYPRIVEGMAYVSLEMDPQSVGCIAQIHVDDVYQNLAVQIRAHCLCMTNRGRSGHVGSMLSMADLLAVLYEKILKVDPANPEWPERDRFILSKGHGGGAVYAVLAEKGFFPKEWLDTYYLDNGKLSGHISHHIPGVEFSTGSLGHGLPVAVGMALAAKQAEKMHRVFCLMSDGDCNEGSTWEAVMFAARHKLDNLTVIVDYNRIQALGHMSEVIEMEPFSKKLEDFGWAAKEIDGHNYEEIEDALSSLPITEGKPSWILARTIKGKGVKFLENTVSSHYKFVSDEKLQEAMYEVGVRK